jgi:NTP pyrophosphatase (non-canonical NTP hydrolase)
MSERSWLADRADEVVAHLRENGFDREGGVIRQVLNLAEEVGEFVGAYRRWTGQARRSGTEEEVHAELADVVITAYVTAAEMGVDLDAAIRAKLDVVFTRGWREQPEGEGLRSTPLLASDGESIYRRFES